MKLIWSDLAAPVADNNCRQVILYIYERGVQELYICNEMMLNEARLLHAQGLIEIDYVEFEDKEITINEHGDLSEWPVGFCDQTINVLRDLCNLKRNKKNVET